LEVQQQFASQGRILVCLEQSRGALIHFLMGYECLELYPLNPKQLANHREALPPSGAKDDPFDAEQNPGIGLMGTQDQGRILTLDIRSIRVSWSAPACRRFKIGAEHASRKLHKSPQAQK
jgi:hypothetical protein